MTDDRPRVVVVAGPTASGKTPVGMELAQRFDGEIVSADSIQVYRFMDIGSAKPGSEELSRVPHHMIDIRNPDEDFTAGDYVKEARRCIRDIVTRGKVPIVVGGTGLYIRLLLGGIIDLPAGDPERRRRLREEERSESGSLFRRLEQVDPTSARTLQKSNLRRVIRALEVFESAGTPLSQLQTEHSFKDRPFANLFICLALDRKVLYERIDMRVDSMIESGLVEEVKSLYRRGYPPELKPLQSLGYRHVGMILAGDMDPGEAIRFMKRDTRRYAKRQLTWFRSEPGIFWCDPADRHGIRFIVDDFLGHRRLSGNSSPGCSLE